jgi:DNA invertase Pin-like site-specific DNA recombinase
MTEAQRAGIELAKTRTLEDEGGRRYKGAEAKLYAGTIRSRQRYAGAGQGIGQIAAATGLPRQTVYRIRDEREKAIAALIEWEKAGKRRRAAGRPGGL